MSEMAVVHIGENSPEYVAFRLMQEVLQVENKLLHPSEESPQKVASRKLILDTYAECLNAVRNPHARVASRPTDR